MKLKIVLLALVSLPLMAADESSFFGSDVELPRNSRRAASLCNALLRHSQKAILCASANNENSKALTAFEYDQIIHEQREALDDKVIKPGIKKHTNALIMIRALRSMGMITSALTGYAGYKIYQEPKSKKSIFWAMSGIIGTIITIAEFDLAKKVNKELDSHSYIDFQSPLTQVELASLDQFKEFLLQPVEQRDPAVQDEFLRALQPWAHGDAPSLPIRPVE